MPAKPEDDDPTIYSLPTFLLFTKADDEAADIRLEMAKEWLGDRFPSLTVSAERGDGMAELKEKLFRILGVMRIFTKQPGKPVEKESPFTCPHGCTVAEFAGYVHNDFEEKVKSARVWGSGAFDGQTVGREHVLQENDIVELHL